MKKPTMKQLKKKIEGELSFCVFVNKRKRRCIGIKKGDNKIAVIGDHPCGEITLQMPPDVCLSESTLVLIAPAVNRTNFELIWKKHYRQPRRADGMRKG